MLQDQVKAMNSKILINSQESANHDTPMHDPLRTQGSTLTRILLIILVALVIVGLIALAISVFTVH